MGIFTKLLEKLSKTREHVFSVDVAQLPQINEVNYHELIRRLNGGRNNTMYYNTPTPTLMPNDYYTTWCGTTYNDEFYTKKIDPKPLFRYVKRMFPFVVDIPKIKQEKEVLYYDPYTMSPKSGKLFEVTVTLSPTHFSEVFLNEKVKDTLNNVMKNSLSSLIICMYENIQEGTIQFEFVPDKSETLLEDMRKLSYL